MYQKIKILIILFIISKIKSQSSITFKKYETGIIENPDNSGIAYFFLELNEFQINDKIYGYFTSKEKNRNNLIFRYNFIDTISTSTISDYKILNDNVFKDDGDYRNFYFNFKKEKDKLYLAFYVKKKMKLLIQEYHLKIQKMMKVKKHLLVCLLELLFQLLL